LASLVVLTHAGFVLGSVRPGPTAVIGFYIISGYVVSFLLDRKVKGSFLKAFYAERFFRIYPQFLFHLVVALTFIVVTGHVSRFTEIRPNIGSILANLTLFPLQARAFSDYLAGATYVPTSWSLALEASFYVMAPFLLRSRLFDFVAGASLLLFMLALLGKTPPQPHTYSYATIFGTLHFFAVGAWLQRRQFKKVGLWAVAMVGIAVLVTLFASWRPPHVQEVIIGGLAGLAIIAVLSKYRGGRFQRIDDFMGRISYPVFLNHFIFIWLFEELGWGLSTVENRTAILVCSWVFGVVAFYIVERPLDAYRRSLRS